MSKRRTITLIISLVLTFAVLGPQAALASRDLDPVGLAASDADPSAPGRAGQGRDEASEGTADVSDPAQPKRKGNGFARALGAPFRALARLFGGGRKSETAKKPAPSQQTTTARNEVKQAKAADSPKPQTQAAARPAPAQTPKVEPLVPVAPARETTQAPRNPEANLNSVAAPPSEGVRIVRPSEDGTTADAKSKMFIPMIVGVPSDPISQGRALLQHGYIQEAIAELQVAATTLGPQLAEANNLLGLAYDRLGWHRQAAEAYGRALAASPKEWIVLANLGYSLYLADDYAGALKRLNQAAKLAPAEPVIFNNLGVVNARLGRHGDAFKNFAKASNEYDAHVKLAAILEEQQRDKEAVAHYEAALRLQPGASAVLERLVALYDRTGQRDKADTARRALSQPKNPQRTATGGGG